jgi:uncharacterized protein YndB with AHSA1/START domain
MGPIGSLTLTLPSDREILFTRVFHAPRHLVYAAHTQPELVKRWLYGPDGWSMTTCEINLRVGGSYRYVWRHVNGSEMGMSGVYLELVPHERIVATEVFDQPWYPGQAVDTTTLTEADGRTTLTTAVRYESKEIRDAVLKSPMDQGMALGFDRLEQVLAALPAGN